MLVESASAARTNLNQEAESQLPQAYVLLADVLSVPQLDSDYSEALGAVLDAAQKSEAAGFSFTLRLRRLDMSFSLA